MKLGKATSNKSMQTIKILKKKQKPSLKDLALSKPIQTVCFWDSDASLISNLTLSTRSPERDKKKKKKTSKDPVLRLTIHSPYILP